MAFTIARTLTCACGKVFTSKGPRTVRCEACQHERNREKKRAWDREHMAQKGEYRAKKRMEKLTEPVKPKERKPIEAKLLPCMGGCGTMILTRNRNGRILCPACRKVRVSESNARYKSSEKYRAWQEADNLKKSMDPELLARKRERDRLRYQKNRAEILAKATEARRAEGILPRKFRPKPATKPVKAEKPRGQKAIKPTVKAVAQVMEKRLPTEQEKLAMLRAALKRYHGG